MIKGERTQAEVSSPPVVTATQPPLLAPAAVTPDSKMMAQCMTSTRSAVAFKSRAAQKPSRGSLKVQAFKVGLYQ